MTETVLVTGISGFIAKHVALALLKEGYTVRGTLRSAKRENDVRAAIAAHGGNVQQLQFVHADLEDDRGWKEAAAGCAYVQHIASPFPMAQPRNRNALVPEARQGTLRVLDAAAKADVERVVLTASMVTMMYRPKRPVQMAVREHDWTDPDWHALSPYIISKTKAEQAAWEWAQTHNWSDRMCAVNPGFVLGPPLDSETSTSLDVIKLILQGTYPALPPVAYPVVDVRDLAALHIATMTVPRAAGRRLIGSGETLTMSDMARLLRQAFPQYMKKIPTRTMPAFLVRLLSIFDPSVRAVVPDLGVRPSAETHYVTELTGVTFRAAREAVIDAARAMITYNAV